MVEDPKCLFDRPSAGAQRRHEIAQGDSPHESRRRRVISRQSKHSTPHPEWFQFQISHMCGLHLARAETYKIVQSGQMPGEGQAVGQHSHGIVVNIQFSLGVFDDYRVASSVAYRLVNRRGNPAKGFFCDRAPPGFSAAGDAPRSRSAALSAKSGAGLQRASKLVISRCGAPRCHREDGDDQTGIGFDALLGNLIFLSWTAGVDHSGNCPHPEFTLKLVHRVELGVSESACGVAVLSFHFPVLLAWGLWWSHVLPWSALPWSALPSPLGRWCVWRLLAWLWGVSTCCGAPWAL